MERERRDEARRKEGKRCVRVDRGPKTSQTEESRPPICDGSKKEPRSISHERTRNTLRFRAGGKKTLSYLSGLLGSLRKRDLHDVLVAQVREPDEDRLHRSVDQAHVLSRVLEEELDSFLLVPDLVLDEAGEGHGQHVFLGEPLQAEKVGGGSKALDEVLGARSGEDEADRVLSEAVHEPFDRLLLRRRDHVERVDQDDLERRLAFKFLYLVVELEETRNEKLEKERREHRREHRRERGRGSGKEKKEKEEKEEEERKVYEI